MSCCVFNQNRFALVIEGASAIPCPNVLQNPHSHTIAAATVTGFLCAGAPGNSNQFIPFTFLRTNSRQKYIVRWKIKLICNQTGAIVTAAAASALELGAGFRLVTAPQVIKRHIIKQLPAQLWRHSCQRYFLIYVNFNLQVRFCFGIRSSFRFYFDVWFNMFHLCKNRCGAYADELHAGRDLLCSECVQIAGDGASPTKSDIVPCDSTGSGCGNQANLPPSERWTFINQ